MLIDLYVKLNISPCGSHENDTVFPRHTYVHRVRYPEGKANRRKYYEIHRYQDWDREI